VDQKTQENIAKKTENIEERSPVEGINMRENIPIQDLRKKMIERARNIEEREEGHTVLIQDLINSGKN
jgi:hypothetical protein